MCGYKKCDELRGNLYQMCSIECLHLFAQNQQKMPCICISIYVQRGPRAEFQSLPGADVYLWSPAMVSAVGPPRRQQGNLFYYFPEANDRCGDEGCVVLCCARRLQPESAGCFSVLFQKSGMGRIEQSNSNSTHLGIPLSVGTRLKQQARNVHEQMKVRRNNGKPMGG